MKKRAPLTFNAEPVAPAVSTVASVTAPPETSLPANTPTRKRAKEETKPGREGRQFIAAHVTPEAAKQFKLLAVQRDRTTQDLLTEAINDVFAKYGLSRIA